MASPVAAHASRYPPIPWTAVPLRLRHPEIPRLVRAAPDGALPPCPHCGQALRRITGSPDVPVVICRDVPRPGVPMTALRGCGAAYRLLAAAADRADGDRA